MNSCGRHGVPGQQGAPNQGPEAALRTAQGRIAFTRQPAHLPGCSFQGSRRWGAQAGPPKPSTQPGSGMQEQVPAVPPPPHVWDHMLTALS